MQFTEHVLKTPRIPTFFCLLLYGKLEAWCPEDTLLLSLPFQGIYSRVLGTPPPAQILLVNLQPGVIA